ncbi:hypothetical protein AKJ16_DCAP08913 [Drosera capensis]
MEQKQAAGNNATHHEDGTRNRNPSLTMTGSRLKPPIASDEMFQTSDGQARNSASGDEICSMGGNTFEAAVKSG